MLKISHGGSYKNLLVGSLLFVGAFGTTFLASSIFTPVTPSSAQDIGAVINASGYYLNLTNSSTVSMGITATAGGTVGITKDTINIKSNAPDGYDLYLSMDNKDTDGNRLYKDANSTSSSYLSPTSGTFSAPAALDTNSWGFALSNTTLGLPAAGSAFDTNYSTTGPADNALFAAVPLQGNEQLIQTITTPDSTNGIDTDIYYGVKANTSLPSGSYKGTVTYTAIAKTNSTINEQTSVSPSVTTRLEGGELITIATMLSINAADAEEAGKEVSVTIGGQACTNIQLSNAQDGSLQISCTSPSMSTGRYDVGVDIPKYDKFWTIVNGIQYKYSTQELDQVTGGNATAADILLGKTAYVGGTELTGTMPSYTVQYDTSKTATENTADAGLTWSSDGSTLTIAEGYHTQQQVNSQIPQQSASNITLAPGASQTYSAGHYPNDWTVTARSATINRVKLGTISGSLTPTSPGAGSGISQSFSVAHIPGYASLTNNNFFIDVTHIDTQNSYFYLSKSLSRSGATVTVFLGNAHLYSSGSATSITADLYVVY